SASRRRRQARPASACAPPNWPCCWTASIGKTPSGRSATTGRRRRRGERAGWVGQAGGTGRPLFSHPSGDQYGPQCVIIGMSLATPAAAGLSPTAAEQLPDDVATLRRMVLELLASLHERDRDIEGDAAPHQPTAAPPVRAARRTHRPPPAPVV